MSTIPEQQKDALFRHLGDVLEAIQCVASCGMHYLSIGEAVAAEDNLSGIALLDQVAPSMAPSTFIERAASAFLLWPSALLAPAVNKPLLAYLVEHDLFADNNAGWQRYIADRRMDVPWFGETVDQAPILSPTLAVQ